MRFRFYFRWIPFVATVLLVTLESHYRVRIDPGDVGADNFDTATQMLAFVRGLR